MLKDDLSPLCFLDCTGDRTPTASAKKQILSQVTAEDTINLTLEQSKSMLRER